MISIRTLREFPIFEGLTDDELERIAAFCREEVYEAGTTIHEEGSVAEYMYIVQGGKVILELELELQPYASPRRTTIEVVSKGEAFGWSALVEPYTRTLSARCTERTSLIILKGSDLLDWFASEPHVGYKVMTGIAKIVGSRLRDTRDKLVSFVRGEELSLEYTPEEATLIQRIHYFVNFRWIAAIGVAVLALVASTVLRIGFPAIPVYVIAIGIASYNLIFWLYARGLTPEDTPDLVEKARRFAAVQSVVDLLALTVLLHFTGGIENPFLFYFVFHITIASILLPYEAAYSLATLAVLMLCSLVGLEYFGIIPHVHLEGFVPPDLYHQETYILAILFTFVTVLYISTYMATSIAGELRKRQREVASLRDRCLIDFNALEEVNKRLTELDRLRTYFLGMVSHDLKAPLVAVESYLQVILGGLAGEISEKQREMLERSSYRIEELLDLIGDLLDFSRIEAGQIVQEFKATSLAEVVEGSLVDVQAMAKEKGIELRVEMPEKLSVIQAASHRLRQVLNNLLSNAIKFTPPQGLITISVEDKRDCLQVEVMDSGAGIPPEDLPYVFDEFFRGRDVERAGAGLGLSIAKKIVEAHGGKIWAESPCTDDGRGSKFTFILPKTSRGVGS
ncbi:MAG: cyclic nucleotide-binding domain-containing protein [Chloroflexi bacterium]|nr:cyclic nucleotide-binding domain-containing protein [Chloroflexota bacterium]